MPASVSRGPDDEAPQRGRATRLFWLSLGLLMVAAGLVGMVVPLLPTIDFMLLALPCFARSSPRLEAWILNHPGFGPGLRAWRERRAIHRHAKVMACLGMAAGYAIFWLHVRPGWAVTLAIGAFLFFWAIWICAARNQGICHERCGVDRRRSADL